MSPGIFPYTLSTFTDAKSMLAAAKVDNVKLLIADIALGTSHYSGIDAVNDLHRTHPQCSVIYLSAYTSYALDVFDTKPLYFIFKEEYKERLPHAVELFFHAYLEQYQYISLARNLRDQACVSDWIGAMTYQMSCGSIFANPTVVFRAEFITKGSAHRKLGVICECNCMSGIGENVLKIYNKAFMTKCKTVFRQQFKYTLNRGIG